MRLIINVLIVFALLFPSKLSAQIFKFKGTIKYKITYSDYKIADSVIKKLPDTYIVDVMGDMIKRTLKKGDIETLVFINHKSRTQTVLFSQNNEKYLVTIGKKTIDSLDKCTENQVLKRQKAHALKIAGYDCDEYQIIDGKDTVVVYKAKKIKFPEFHWLTNFQEVEGVLLKYSQRQNNMTVTYTAIDVKHEKLPMGTFEISEKISRIKID